MAVSSLNFAQRTSRRRHTTCINHIGHVAVPVAQTIIRFSMPSVCSKSISRECTLRQLNLWSWVSFLNAHILQTQLSARSNSIKRKLITSRVRCMTTRLLEEIPSDSRNKALSAKIASWESQNAEQMKKRTLKWARSRLELQEYLPLVAVRSESSHSQTWTLCKTNSTAVSWWTTVSVWQPSSASTSYLSSKTVPSKPIR